MTSENKENLFFFYGETKVPGTKPVMTGAEIKAAIKAVVSTFDVSHDLVLEGQGNEQDTLIKDSDQVTIEHGHGEGPKHFFSKPPTNFGIDSNVVANAVKTI